MKLPLEPNTENETYIQGVAVSIRQYIGIGPLNVDTGRGECQAFSTDYILTFATGRKCVVPCHVGVEWLRRCVQDDVIEVVAEEDQPADVIPPTNANTDVKPSETNDSKKIEGQTGLEDDGLAQELAAKAERDRQLEEQLKGL